MTDYTLHCGDCLDIMPTLEAGSIDAIICDPPYNVGFKYTSHDDNNALYEQWCQSWFYELKRICNGPIAISVGQTNLSMWARIAPPDWWLAWWKPAAMGRCVVGFNNWEPIAFYGKPTTQLCDVIRAPIVPDDSTAGHPCPKPLEWAVKQVQKFTKPGALILDPFMGSGTTGVAAIQEGRRFVGIEKDAGYFEIAQKRISETTRQPALLEVA